MRINVPELLAELPNHPQITGELAKVNEETDRKVIEASYTAANALVYLNGIDRQDLADYLASNGVRVSNSGKLLTEGKLSLDATKLTLGYVLGVIPSWRVGKPEEGKSINLLPGNRGWMNVLMKGEEVVRVRPATAADFESAPRFEVAKPAMAFKLWHKVGELLADWQDRHDRGETFTASLPELPVKESKEGSKKGTRSQKGRNERRSSSPSGNAPQGRNRRRRSHKAKATSQPKS